MACAEFVQALGSVGMKIVNVVKFVAKAAATHGGSLAIDVPKMVVNLICSWKEIYEAGKAFATAWKSNDILVKYEKYGFFVGKMFSVLIDVIVGRKKAMKKRRLI